MKDIFKPQHVYKHSHGIKPETPWIKSTISAQSWTSTRDN